MSETQFDRLYGTDALCHPALVRWRWPEGFMCPGCEGRKHCIVKRGARIGERFLVREISEHIGTKLLNAAAFEDLKVVERRRRFEIWARPDLDHSIVAPGAFEVAT